MSARGGEEGRTCDELPEENENEKRAELTVSRVLLGSKSEDHYDKLRVGVGLSGC